MKTKNLYAGMLVLVAAFFSTSALAAPVTMTLETLVKDQDTAYLENGFNVVAPGAHLHAAFNDVDFTNSAQMAADTSGMSLSKNDSGKFNFISFDVTTIRGADFNPALNKSFALQIDGIVGGAVQVSKQLLSGGIGTIDFLSESALWGGLDEVQFWYSSQPTGFGSLSSFNGDNLLFDNITVEASVSSVPVPAAVWLFFSALGGLGIMRKKQTVAA